MNQSWIAISHSKARGSRTRTLCRGVIESWTRILGLDFWTCSFRDRELCYCREMVAYQSRFLVQNHGSLTERTFLSDTVAAVLVSPLPLTQQPTSWHCRSRCKATFPFGNACSRLVRHACGRRGRLQRFVKFAISGSFPPHFVLLFWYFVCSPCCAIVNSLLLHDYLRRPSWSEKLSSLGQQQDATLYAPRSRLEDAGTDGLHDFFLRGTGYSNTYNKAPFELSVPPCGESLSTIQLHTLRVDFFVWWSLHIHFV